MYIIFTKLKMISKLFSALGGLIMLMLAAITVASITGRTFFGQSLVGDYELTEVGLSISVFLFMPYCYCVSGHVVVDLFTAHCQESTLNILDKIGDIIFIIVFLLLSYRLISAGLESYKYMEQTMILELDVWWSYVVGAVSFLFCALCSVSKLLVKSSRVVCYE